MRDRLSYLGRAILLAALALLMAAAPCSATVRGDLSTRFEEPKTITLDGVTYQYKRDLETILFIGVDTTLETGSTLFGSRGGGQSDFLLLAVIDKGSQSIRLVHLDRDVMTPVTVLDVLGRESGTRVLQLCLSHGFGDGGKQSCELTRKAVSTLLLDAQIDHYIAVNIDAIPVINDALGGVTVTLTDDFSALDPAMTPGTTLTLRGKQAEYFVRYRMGIGEGTNAVRMLRQRAYLAEVGRIAQERIRSDKNFVGVLFDELEPVLVSDMRRGGMINIAWTTRDYERGETLSLEGEHVLNENGYIEFYADEDSLMRLIVDAFYEPVP